ERDLRKHGVAFTKALKQGSIARAAEALKLGSTDEMLIKVGYGTLTTKEVVELVVPAEQRHRSPEETSPQSPLSKLLRKVTGRSSSTGIVVEGEDGIMVRFARCCSPLPGDSIVGFITRGRG